MGVDPGGFSVKMAHDGLQNGQIHAAADCIGDKCMPTGIWSQTASADLVHEIFPLSFCIVRINMAATIAGNQQVSMILNGFLADLPVGCQPIRSDGDDAVFAGFRFAAPDKIIIKAICNGNLEQFTGTAAT